MTVVATLYIYNASFFLQGMINDASFTFSVGDITWAIYNISLSKTNRIGDTKYKL